MEENALYDAILGIFVFVVILLATLFVMRKINKYE